MAADPQESPMEGVPGTPGIREVRPESSSENFGFCTETCRMSTGSGDPNHGIRRVSLRAEIDTSPPFGSVKEAVTRFGGSGPWIPLCKFLESYHGIEEFDIKKVEEQAAELEKDLIVKELETLDVLEELGSTKKIVEELKRQLQNEALKCMISSTTPDMSSADDQHNLPAPAIKEMNKEHYEQQQMRINGGSSPCPMSSPDLILMELKQAKLNLGKTINDLGMIQTSVESLNKKMKKEKSLLEKTRERLTCKFAGVASLEEELNRVRVKPQIGNNAAANHHGSFENSSNVLRSPLHNNARPEQFKKMVDPAKTEHVPRAMQPLGNEQNKSCTKAAEMRWVAAKKMEEAARAAEALALIEMNALAGIKDLSVSENSSGFLLPEPEPSSRTPKFQRAAEQVSNRKMIHAMHKFAEANVSELTILRKMEEASEEVKISKEALEEALNRMEIANRKQLDAEEALRRWIPEHEQKKQVVYSATKINNYHPPHPHPHPHHQPQHLPRSPLHDLNKQNPTVDDEPKPILKPTVSMRDILSTKQVTPEDCVVKRPNEGHSTERQKVALSQMLHELREDMKLPPKPDQKDNGDDQKQYFTQRRKFGFIHISLPLAKQGKKKPQVLNAM